MYFTVFMFNTWYIIVNQKRRINETCYTECLAVITYLACDDRPYFECVVIRTTDHPRATEL